MNRKEAKRLLAREMDQWREKGYEALADRVGEIHVVEREGADGANYSIEVEVVRNGPEGALRVVGSIDDCGFFSGFVPLSADFLKTPDGTIVE